MKKWKRANSKNKNKNKTTRDEYTKNKKLYDLVISKKFLFNWYFVTLFSVEQDQNVRFKCSHSCKSCNFNSFNSIHLFSVSFMFLCFYHGSTNPPTTQAQTVLQHFVFFLLFDSIFIKLNVACLHQLFHDFSILFLVFREIAYV